MFEERIVRALEGQHSYLGTIAVGDDQMMTSRGELLAKAPKTTGGFVPKLSIHQPSGR